MKRDPDEAEDDEGKDSVARPVSLISTEYSVGRGRSKCRNLDYGGVQYAGGGR